MVTPYGFFHRIAPGKGKCRTPGVKGFYENYTRGNDRDNTVDNDRGFTTGTRHIRKVR